MWVRPYVGLSWLRLGRTRQGLDCWGLNRLALGEQRELWLPLYDTVDPADRASVASAVAIGREEWIAVSEIDMRDFDFILMRSDMKVLGRRIAADVHFGLAAPNRHILHVQEGGSSVLQPFASLRHRVVEILRHKELA
jgi:hypothetical protein